MGKDNQTYRGQADSFENPYESSTTIAANENADSQNRAADLEQRVEDLERRVYGTKLTSEDFSHRALAVFGHWLVVCALLGFAVFVASLVFLFIRVATSF